MPTHYDKEFKQNIINLYKQGTLMRMMPTELKKLSKNY
ncbi:hypothetical protein LAP8965_03124 [Lactiplantibacillus plantarum]|nr:hypothetical protein LAP8963_03044 [Lactiplantibacillus plantarum]SPE13645.1 hypothetical protein LAP8964_03040 [Lactiplantibacillus plantarum]SPH08340.1 hypothetical protein LAP8965_03124 [Lactiplantibacillus plantarum]SPH10899.1 hypothetical protein LAP8966_03113 [Lactiplantibacillus plantarum]